MQGCGHITLTNNPLHATLKTLVAKYLVTSVKISLL